MSCETSPEPNYFTAWLLLHEETKTRVSFLFSLRCEHKNYRMWTLKIYARIMRASNRFEFRWMDRQNKRTYIT
uniref:Ovule protein n=1 Tax=Romanomermis culicivorax TaxID=13658 RepID=A0A915I818_ROMCU